MSTQRSESAFIIFALALLLADVPEWTFTRAGWLLIASIYLFIFAMRCYTDMRDK